MPVVKEDMVVSGTPVEDYSREYGLWVKREDMCCPPPGPPFSKARGVYAHLRKRPEKLIGVLDTRHSQGGWAVARACQLLGKDCLVYYPSFKARPDPGQNQYHAAKLGAGLVGIPAGRSAILYHTMKREIEARGGYAVPNALKLPESVVETSREVPQRIFDWVVIPVSSGTLAAGVIAGYSAVCRGLRESPRYLLHLGYSRPEGSLRDYVRRMSGTSVPDSSLFVVDERYSYKDVAREGPTPPWPCNPYYDLKTFRWWLREGRQQFKGSVLFWNIG
jgi:Pyridoxal-phosphate dependent enzyme